MESRKPLPFAEFVCLMALMTGQIALSIDAMLPALPGIGRDLQLADINDAQLIISFLFLGMTVGQLLFGPLSDRLGRKPTVFMGMAFYIGGCILSYYSTSLEVMLAGRVIQGFGVSAPRVVSMALIRDQYKGDTMARVMSFIMMVFIMVPAIAPALGQLIIKISHWRSIFAVFLVLAVITLAWFLWRQPETLQPQNRIPFTPGRILGAVKEVCTGRISLGYTVAAGFVFAAFLGYLSSIQQVLQDGYGLGRQFPLYFGLLALAIGAASFLNGKLVMRFGMSTMCSRAGITLTAVSLIFLALALYTSGHPPLWMLMLYFTVNLFCVGILFGNLNSLAMEPLGHIAGVGAAVVGSLSTVVALPFGIFIGQSYNGTVTPMIAGFVVFGILLVVLLRWIEKKKGT